MKKIADVSFILSHYRSHAVGDFYETRIEIWAGFGPVGITDYEQLLRPIFFQVFVVKKKYNKNIVVSALKSCIK